MPVPHRLVLEGHGGACEKQSSLNWDTSLKIIGGNKVWKESEIPSTAFFCQAFARQEQRADLACQKLSCIDFSSTAGGPASE